VLCFAEEREVGIEDGCCEQRDELFEKATTIDTILDLVVLVYKDNLPLLARINVLVDDLVDRILKQVLTSHFNLFNFVAVSMFMLDSRAKDSEQFGSDVKVVNPRDVAHKILSHDIRDLS